MEISNLKKVTISVLMALNITAIGATVNVLKEHAPVNENITSTFSQVGMSGEKAAFVKGFGKEMPFTISLDVIIPDSWEVTYNEGSELEDVNWEGGTPWPYVLKDLSEKNNVSVSIDWEHKHVDLFSHSASDNVLERKIEDNAIVELFSKEQHEMESAILLEKETLLREQYELEQTITMAKLKSKEDAEKAQSDYILTLEDDKKLLNNEKEILEKELLDIKVIQENEVEDSMEIELVDSDIIESDVESIVDNIDIESFKSEYNLLTVLPLDASFDFYIQGGYEQTFDYLTPATFIATKNKTIYEVITEWSETIGWELTWNTNVHYHVDFDMRFEGIFRESATSLIKLYKDAPRPLDIEYYPEQKLIVVKDLEFK
jgi:hypothetical protein